jgi:hypothetical protein
MPRPPASEKSARPRPLAPVPGAGLDAHRRTDGSNRTRRRARSIEPPDARIGLPRLCRPPENPLESRQGIKRRLPSGKTRAPAVSDRIWPDETREISPAPSGLSAAHASTRPNEGVRSSEAEATDDHKGSHRAADPGALLAGLNPSAKRLGEIFCCAASLARNSGEIRAPCGRGRVEMGGARRRRDARGGAHARLRPLNSG